MTHEISLDNQVDQALYLVIDTSFLLHAPLMELWTGRVSNVIQENKTHVIIPKGVEDEYHSQFQQGVTDNFGVSVPYFSIDDLVENKDISIYNRMLDVLLSRELDKMPEEYYRTPRPLSRRSNLTALSRTDKSVVQAVLDYAREGRKVGIASADYSILSRVDGISDEENLGIQTYSPWSTPTQQGFSPLEIKYLASGNVFGELLNTNTEDNKIRYFGITKDVHIGGGIYYDVAFGMFTRKFIYKPLPQIEDVYFLPLMMATLSKSGNSAKEYPRYTSFNSFSSLAFYYTPIPIFVSFLQQKPIHPLEYKKLNGRVKNREVDRIDAERELMAKRDIKTLNWARIEDWHIGIFDQLSVGKLQDLRNKLRHYQQ